MKTTHPPRRAALAGAALAFFACGGSVTVPGVSPGPYDTCAAPTDCAWGEIDHEISSSSDCVCLFGCPHLPLSKATVDRRTAQYNAVCTPGTDGKGNPCPVDDCAAPPKLDCQAGKCAAASP